MSAPFFGKEFTFTQPDGTPLNVRGWGNQHHAHFETLDGHTVVQDPATGFYEYATHTLDGGDLQPTGVVPEALAADALKLDKGIRRSAAMARSLAREASGLPRGGTRWEERRAQARNAPRPVPGLAPAPPQRQTVGDYLGLVLLIDFPDVPGTFTPSEVERYCNEPGYSGFGNNGSVFDYFHEISSGKLRYRNRVTPSYYTARKPRSYYTNEDVDQPIRARELIREALTHWKQQGFDFNTLTKDADDYVYAVNVFHAGPTINNWAEGLWPHCFHLGTPFQLGPGMLAFDYQITSMGSELTLGTFCHENGHMICDFPDLYDYGGESFGVGMYCLMCAGNFDEKNPTSVGAYLRYRAGWVEGVALEKGSFHCHVSDHKVFLHMRSPTEYFVIENRQRSGRDQSLAASGLAIWHVDELGDNSEEWRTAARHYECSLIQADGKVHLERRINRGDPGDLFFQGGKDAFGRETQPAAKWWDGTHAGIEIAQIGPSGNAIPFVVLE